MNTCDWHTWITILKSFSSKAGSKMKNWVSNSSTKSWSFLWVQTNLKIKGYISALISTQFFTFKRAFDLSHSKNYFEINFSSLLIILEVNNLNHACRWLPCRPSATQSHHPITQSVLQKSNYKGLWRVLLSEAYGGENWCWYNFKAS